MNTSIYSIHSLTDSCSDSGSVQLGMSLGDTTPIRMATASAADWLQQQCIAAIAAHARELAAAAAATNQSDIAGACPDSIRLHTRIVLQWIRRLPKSAASSARRSPNKVTGLYANATQKERKTVSRLGIYEEVRRNQFSSDFTVQ